MHRRHSIMASVAPTDPVGESLDISSLFNPPYVMFSLDRAMELQRKKHILKLRDGRDLAYIVDGDPSKPAVILCHGIFGSGGTLIGPPRDDLYMILPDRPNYGQSSPHKDYTFASWAEDVRELVDHLKIECFHVIGASSGGPSALAVKSLLGNRCKKCVIISGDTQYAKTGDEFLNGELMCFAPGKACSPCLPLCCLCCLPIMKSGMNFDSMWANIENGKFKEAGMSSEIDYKLALAAGKDHLGWNTQLMIEEISRGSAGPIGDAINESKPWPFEVSHLVDVDLWHGTADVSVPYKECLSNKKLMPNAQIRTIEGAGHDMGIRVVSMALDHVAKSI